MLINRAGAVSIACCALLIGTLSFAMPGVSVAPALQGDWQGSFDVLRPVTVRLGADEATINPPAGRHWDFS